MRNKGFTMQAVYTIERRTSLEALDEIALKIGRPGSRYDLGFYYSYPQMGEDPKRSDFTRITVAVKEQQDAENICDVIKKFLGNDVLYCHYS